MYLIRPPKWAYFRRSWTTWQKVLFYAAMSKEMREKRGEQAQTDNDKQEADTKRTGTGSGE